MDAIQSAASGAIINIALGLIGFLSAYATYGLYKLTEKARAQTAQIKEETARKRLEDALSDVERLVIATVDAIEQTTASHLRAAVKDGKVSVGMLKLLAHQARDEIKAEVSPEVRELVRERFGSFDGYVAKLIEERVLKIKSSNGR